MSKDNQLTELEDRLRQLSDQEICSAFMHIIGRERLIKCLVEFCKRETNSSNANRLRRVKASYSAQDAKKAVAWVVSAFSEFVERTDDSDAPDRLILRQSVTVDGNNEEHHQEMIVSAEAFALTFIDIILDDKPDKISRMVKKSGDLHLGYSDWLRKIEEDIHV